MSSGLLGRGGGLLPSEVVGLALEEWAELEVGRFQGKVLGVESLHNFVNLVVWHDESEADWVGLLADNLVFVVVVSLHLSLEGTFHGQVLLEEAEDVFVEVSWVLNTVKDELGQSLSGTWAWAHVISGQFSLDLE